MEPFRKALYDKLCEFERKVYRGEINGSQHEDFLMEIGRDAEKAGIARSDFIQLCTDAYHAMKSRNIPNYLEEHGRYYVYRDFIARFYSSFDTSK